MQPLAGFEVVAHRGARTLADSREMACENTLPAFQAAARRGASIELDVIATRDGQLVVHHDDCSGKLFTLPNGDRFLREATYPQIRQARFNPAAHEADVLKMLGPNARYQLDPRFAHAEIPTLQAVLDALPPDTRLYIELKVPEKWYYPASNNRLAERVAELIAQRNLYDRVSVISFSPAALRRVKQRDPRIRTGLDFAMPASRQNPLTLALLMGLAKRVLGLSSLHMRYQDATPAMVAAAHRQGLRVVPYVSDQTRAEEAAMFPQLMARGVDGLITNAVDLLQQALSDFGRPSV